MSVLANTSYRDRLDADVTLHSREIAGMLRELADACDEFYEQETGYSFLACEA